MRTDSNWNDSGTNYGITKQVYGAGIPPKETTATAKERPNFLVEVKAKTPYGLKTIARKFLKYGQVKRILMHQYIMPSIKRGKVK